MIHKVAVMGHPVLRQVAKPIPKEDILSPAIQTLIQDMAETMVEYDGRGLAAPQIAQSLQLVVILWDFEPEEEPTLLVLINPQIEALTKEMSTFGEGCLSVPGLRGDVARPNKIRVKAFNEKAEELDFVAEGFCATVVQHECDHLLGKLYIDRMTDLTKLAFLTEYGRYLSSDSTTEDESA